jgi:hypothetical protein
MGSVCELRAGPEVSDGGDRRHAGAAVSVDDHEAALGGNTCLLVAEPGGDRPTARARWLSPGRVMTWIR